MVKFELLRAFVGQSWPPKSRFSVQDIPDLTGKVTIVTGGYGGVGKETVKALLLHNATVYLAGRDEAQSKEAIDELQALTSKTALFLRLDLANLASVRDAADEFLSKETKLHILFNNAGVLYPPIEQLTADGYDLQFGVHVLGHYYLTMCLMDALVEGAKDSPAKARVVTTSSIGHLDSPVFDVDTLTDTPKRRALTPHQLYCESKLGSVYFARELAKRYADRGIVSSSCNPGNLWTNLQRNTSGLERLFLQWLCSAPPFGALTQLYAGTSPETVDLNGQYFIPWARLGKPSKAAFSDEHAQQMWEWCEGAIKQFESPQAAS